MDIPSSSQRSDAVTEEYIESQQTQSFNDSQQLSLSIASNATSAPSSPGDTHPIEEVEGNIPLSDSAEAEFPCSCRPCQNHFNSPLLQPYHIRRKHKLMQEAEENSKADVQMRRRQEIRDRGEPVHPSPDSPPPPSMMSNDADSPIELNDDILLPSSGSTGYGDQLADWIVEDALDGDDEDDESLLFLNEAEQYDNDEDGFGGEYDDEQQLAEIPDDPSLADFPPAFSESPSTRNAYIRIFLLHAFKGATKEMIKEMLAVAKAQACSLSNLTDGQIDNVMLEKFAKTLPTLEKRLGLDTSAYITYSFICNKCFFRHAPETLYDLFTPECTQFGCSGILYTSTPINDPKLRHGTDVRRQEKRTPTKLFPHISLEKALQRILLIPGKYDEFQHWRGRGDEPGPAEPIPFEDSAVCADSEHTMHDIYDGWGWRAIESGLQRRMNDDFSVDDVTPRNIHQRFVSLPCGLVLIMNIDWFQPMSQKKHSTGVLYVNIVNNPRSIRFHRNETILAAVFPGEFEPSLEQINHLLAPFVKDVENLFKGKLFKVHGMEDKQEVHVKLHLNCCDLVAARKSSGFYADTSDEFMCTNCTATFASITQPHCFVREHYEKRDDIQYLQHSFEARDADPAERRAIAEKTGKRWSEVDGLAGWMPSRDTPLDFMHAFLLNIGKHVIQVVLHGCGMFNAAKRTDIAPLTKIEQWLARSVIWPKNVGRLPNKIIAGGGRVKADQWRNFMPIAPVALLVGWGAKGFKIPDEDAPPAPQSSKVAASTARSTKLVRERKRKYLASQDEVDSDEIDACKELQISRNYLAHYRNVLQLCVSIRILGARSITPAEVRRAQDSLGRAFQNWARMNCHLTPYFHLVMHLEDFILRNGPVYTTWLMSWERDNYWLSKVRTNSRAGGVLESTLARAWWKSLLIGDLLEFMNRLPSKDADDLDTIETLKRHLSAQSETSTSQGTLLSYMSTTHAAANPGAVTLPRQSKIVNLMAISNDIYDLVFEFLREHWKFKVKLVTPTSTKKGEIFMGNDVKSYTHVLVDQVRYGAGSTTRGLGYRFGYIDGRIPVQIANIYSVTHTRDDKDDAPLTASIAIVQRFNRSPQMPEMPWDLWAADLGMDTWYANSFMDPEVVLVKSFSGQFVIAPLRGDKRGDSDLWITVSLDHSGQEPDRGFGAEDDIIE